MKEYLYQILKKLNLFYETSFWLLENYNTILAQPYDSLNNFSVTKRWREIEKDFVIYQFNFFHHWKRYQNTSRRILSYISFDVYCDIAIITPSYNDNEVEFRIYKCLWWPFSLRRKKIYFYWCFISKYIITRIYKKDVISHKEKFPCLLKERRIILCCFNRFQPLPCSTVPCPSTRTVHTWLISRIFFYTPSTTKVKQGFSTVYLITKI